MDEYEQDGYGPAPTQSSIAAPLIRALLFAALAFLIYAIIFGDLLGGDDDLSATEPPESDTSAPVALETEASPLEVMPTTTPTATPTASPDPTGTESPGAGGDIGAGVSAQVLAGANTTAEQKNDAIQVLTDLGYDVTDAGVSGNPYPETTVFATAGEEEAARALVAADDRFTTYGENPGNLTDQIQIHVLVGEDWPT